MLDNYLKDKLTNAYSFEKYQSLSVIEKKQCISLLLEKEYIADFFSKNVWHDILLSTALVKDLIEEKKSDFFKVGKYQELFHNIVINFLSFKGELELAQELLELGMKNNMPEQLSTLTKIPIIHYTAAFGQFKLTQKLVDYGVNLNKIDEYKESLLDSAIRNDENFEMFDYLFNLPQVNKKISHLYVLFALENDYKEVLELIKKSDVVDDDSFMEKVKNACKDRYPEFFIWLEKRKLEKLCDTTHIVSKKLKL